MSRLSDGANAQLTSSFSRSHVSLYSATLPKPLKTNETATLVLTTIQSHASVPLPATIRQTEPLFLQYSSDLYVLSGYDTAIQRLKVR